jgi:HSP20 family molecular chaperone IbpA
LTFTSEYLHDINRFAHIQTCQSVEKIEDTTSKSGDWKPDDVPQLTVYVYKKNETIYVVSTVAGVKPEDLDVVSILECITKKRA